ncbi:PepSY domain-containing protein [Candidatus Woesearchaeota archaeon]|nr:PepSY domain-containing protein [Candidatus Woesearchaeota archaeon]
MNIKDALKKVEASRAFKQFRKEHKDYYLVHCFAMVAEGEKDYKWELGYYSEKRDKLVVFEAGQEITMRPEEDAFKKEGTIKKLELGKVKASVAKVLKACDELVQKKYPGKSITKRIIILQNLETQVYNITLVTLSFDILNIRVDAVSGKILSDNIQNIMSLGKRLGANDPLPTGS